MHKVYRPPARRFSAVGGEIDLIVARGDTIAFVEVKGRPEIELALEGARSGTTPPFSPRSPGAARACLSPPPGAMAAPLAAAAVVVAPRRCPRHVPGTFELHM